jgi:hypothetical protein
MARVLEVPIPDDLLAVLDARAGDAGMKREEYASDLLRRGLGGPRSLDEILAPFRAQVHDSSINDEELTRLFQAARDAAASDRHTSEIPRS